MAGGPTEAPAAEARFVRPQAQPADAGTVRNRIFGAIGVLWGGAILVSRLISGHLVSGSGPYATGQIAGLVFGVLLFVVGLYYFIKGGGKTSKPGSAPPAA